MSLNFFDSFETKITQEMNMLIINLHQELENLTGKKYEISIRELGKNPLNVTPFDKRNSIYIVSNMKKEYEDLNGIYENCNQIDSKIEEFVIKEITDNIMIIDNKKIWNCRKCNCFGKQFQNNISYNHLDNLICQNCYNVYSSKWKFVKSYPSSNQIAITYGGSISPIIKIGDLFFN
jgi:hypothetical protein